MLLFSTSLQAMLAVRAARRVRSRGARGCSNVTADGTSVRMDDIVSLCRRRGFIFPSSQIYSGFSGFFDYGPYGVELKNNLKQAWWQDMVHRREDVVGLECSIISSPSVWHASGHLDNFSDPMVDCKESKMRFRADHLHYAPVVVGSKVIGYVSVMEDDERVMQKSAKKQAKKLIKAQQLDIAHLEPLVLRTYSEASESEFELIPSPETGKPGSLTPPREFNLMFQTQVGAIADAASTAYLRPETCQGIFTNFRNVVSTARTKLPFGIAQIGKAFRNEITPRNFVFRSREFEQMEIEYFIPPQLEGVCDADDLSWQNQHKKWLGIRREWLESIGLRSDMLSLEVHPSDKLAHYAKACTDIMFQFPFGVQELEGIAARGDYDLRCHQEGSGSSLETEYYDDDNKRHQVLPQVIEPSVGVDRLLLALLVSSYCEDVVGGDKRTYLRLPPRVAPVKVAVLPLVKNKPPLLSKAREVFGLLQRRHSAFWDETGKIGRRYRRMDEIGTPFCVTVDFDTLEDGTVTLRHRDSTEQTRLSVNEALSVIDAAVYGEM